MTGHEYSIVGLFHLFRGFYSTSIHLIVAGFASLRIVQCEHASQRGPGHPLSGYLDHGWIRNINL